MLSEEEGNICFEFLEKTKRNFSFHNIRYLFGVQPEISSKENGTGDVFRVEAFNYFSSVQSGFDYIDGEMNLTNKLAVIKKLHKICEMCVNPF